MDKIEDIDGDIDGGKGFLKVSASPKHGSCYTELSRKEHVHDYSLHARMFLLLSFFFQTANETTHVLARARVFAGGGR